MLERRHAAPSDGVHYRSEESVDVTSIALKHLPWDAHEIEPISTLRSTPKPRIELVDEDVHVQHPGQQLANDGGVVRLGVPVLVDARPTQPPHVLKDEKLEHAAVPNQVMHDVM